MAKHTAIKLGVIALVVFLLLMVSGCDPQARGFALPPGEVERGKATFVELGCNHCHSIDRQVEKLANGDESIVFGQSRTADGLKLPVEATGSAALISLARMSAAALLERNAQPSDADLPHHDPMARRYEHPVRDVELAPYLAPLGAAA